MFGAKKETTTALWKIQILTTDYLVEGSVAPDKVGGQNIWERASQLAVADGGAAAFRQLRLSDAKLQPTGNLKLPAQTFAEWNMTTADAVIAIIPNDAGSLQAGQKAFKDFSHPMTGVVFAGPYVMQAKLLSDSGDRNRSPFSMTEFLPVADAKIDCLLPDAALKDFRVPWLLLKGTGLLHGYGTG